MITFFPGPSQVHSETGQYLSDAFQSGILSVSHRSETFNKLSEETLKLLHFKLAIPESYTILYTSSATESWEIIAQSLTRNQSAHYSSGSFGDKWFQYAQSLRPASRKFPLHLNEELHSEYLDIVAADEIICLTQNETSNGTQIGFETMAALRGSFPDKLIAYDCTSSMAGINLPYIMGDIWFASVQKCFGLPAGLGLLILSPSAIKRAHEIGDKKHYNSVLTMLEHIEKFQTSCTPNVLGIYLLNRVLQNSPGIERTDALLRKRMENYLDLFSNSGFKPLISNSKIRSTTVLALEGEPDLIDGVKAEAKAQGILLGSGYGKWKSNTFRVANFPAFTEAQIEQLFQFIRLLG